MTIECPGCGHRLEVPAGLADGAELACGHCRLLVRNTAALRAFRWAALDPEVRARGARRRALWGGAAVAFLWIPVVGVLLLLRGRFDAVLLGTLALPYVGLPPLLESRARTPPVEWLGDLSVGVGVYLLYVAAVFLVMPRWHALLATTGVRVAPALLLAFGVAALAGGAITIVLYRRRVARAPRFFGTPPP